MAISLYKKGVSHVVDGVHCTVVTVQTVDDMNALLADGEHFHTVAEVYAPADEKPKKGRKTKPVEGASEVVESAESEPVAGADEDENSAD